MSPKVEDTHSSLPQEIDTLSSLPQEIVSHILSLMPTKFAVQTSILSRKWRYNWTLVTNLSFDDTRNNPYHGSDRFTKFVDRVLKDFKMSQVKLFQLKVFEFSVQKSSVSRWIDKAVALRVGELDIQVFELELPLSFFTCKTLIKLRLQLRMREDINWECPSSVNLPCLKTLDIIAYNNPLVNVFKLIHGCPMLESLSLEIVCRREEEDYMFNIPTLKRLKMSYVSIINKAMVNKIVLHVPNLEYLFVGGILCSSFRMVDMSSLDEAYVSLRYITYDHLWVELLKGLSKAKSLSIQHIPISSLLPVFPNMKSLELKSFLHSTRILQFLESCPELNHLYVEKCGKSSWIEPKVVPLCLLTTLTTIKFPYCNGQKSERQLLEYMLKNAEVLKTVTITWENLFIEAMQLWEWLLKVSKASRNYEIHFTGNHSLVYWYINRLC